MVNADVILIGFIAAAGSISKGSAWGVCLWVERQVIERFLCQALGRYAIAGEWVANKLTGASRIRTRSRGVADHRTAGEIAGSHCRCRYESIELTGASDPRAFVITEEERSVTA